MWVTHQNLARAKGGRPGRQFNERQRMPASKPKASAAATPAPVAEQPPVDVAPAAEGTASSDGGTDRR